MTTRDAAIPTPIASRVPDPELLEEVEEESPSKPEKQQHYSHRKYLDQNRTHSCEHTIRATCRQWYCWTIVMFYRNGCNKMSTDQEQIRERSGYRNLRIEPRTHISFDKRLMPETFNFLMRNGSEIILTMNHSQTLHTHHILNSFIK